MHAQSPVFPWKKATFLHERALAEAEASHPESEAERQQAERRAQREAGPGRHRRDPFPP
jgi:hypothetical protein